MGDGARKEWLEDLLENLDRINNNAQTDDEKMLMYVIVKAFKDHVTFYDDDGNLKTFC